MVVDGAQLRKSKVRKPLIKKLSRGYQLSDAVVLYLSGPDDIDREVALSKGFKNHNLIAIDKEPEYINKVRQAGNLGLCVGLGPVISSWGKEPKINVIIADFCCGITGTVRDFIDDLLLSNGIGAGCILAVNLMRGRDKESKWIRRAYPETKHRGELFYHELRLMRHRMQFALDQLQVAQGGIRVTIERDRKNKRRGWRRGLEKVTERINRLIDEGFGTMYSDHAFFQHMDWEDFMAEPSYFTYRSTTGNYMDSAVFRIYPVNDEDKVVHRVPEISRHLAPVKAWRTIRKTEHGGYS